MTTQTEALDMITKLRLAHQAMEAACERIDQLKAENKALKEALAPPKREPAATIRISHEGSTRTIDNHFADRIRDWPDGEYKLYTTPPQRTWVGLTDEEIWQLVNDCVLGGDLHPDKFARIIEAKLKEKNT